VQPALFQHEEERVLHQMTEQLQERVTEAVGRFDSEETFSLLETLTEPVNRFFDAVLVMAPDEAIRRNRLLLLAGVDALYRIIGDFSKLVV
jgi:glycyl-tRNA synthetase beta chain